MPSFGFIGPAYTTRGKVGESEDWLNMYIERIESGMGAARPTAYQAFPTPGKALLCTLSDGPVSAVAASQNPDVGPTSGPLFFAVGGSTLFAINIDTSTPVPTGTFSIIGSVESVAIPGSGGQLLPCTLIVLNPNLIFCLCPTGNAFLAAYGAAITTSLINPGGVGYAVGDTGGLIGGLITAVYTVTSVDGSGGVTGYTLAGGTGYLGGTIYQTQTGGTQPGTGIGFAVQVPVGDVAANAWLVTELNGSPLAQALGAPGVLFLQSATYLDGYVIVGLSPNSGTPENPNLSRTFFISGLNDPNSWNALDFGVKEASPDGIQAVYAAYEILNLLGTATTELWQNTGNALFPFQRLPGGGVIQVGLASSWAIATMGMAGVVWLANDARGQYTAWMLSGSSPQRISNHAIENHWAGFDVSGASIYTYTENGHNFAVFQFPVPDETWVYDANLGPGIGWHRRASWNGSSFHADLGRYHAYTPSIASGFPLHLVGDYSNGNLYLQSMQFLNENCSAIRRIRVCPHLVNEKKWQFIQRFRLHCLTGQVPVGSNPVFDLRISKDGGQTWGPYLDMPAGATGAFEQVIDWYTRVRGRDIVFEWSTSEQIDIVLVEAYTEGYSGTG